MDKKYVVKSNAGVNLCVGTLRECVAFMNNSGNCTKVEDSEEVKYMLTDLIKSKNKLINIGEYCYLQPFK